MKKVSFYSHLVFLLAAFVLCAAVSVSGQDDVIREGKVERIKVHGKSLEGNLAADSPDREVSVYLPPFYIGLPIKSGELQPMVLAKWTANRPLATIDQYIFNIRKLKGLAFDAGTDDRGIAASIKELDQVLNRYGIKHFYEKYEGDHINQVAERIGTKLLTFFSDHLSFKQSRKQE